MFQKIHIHYFYCIVMRKHTILIKLFCNLKCTIMFGLYVLYIIWVHFIYISHDMYIVNAKNMHKMFEIYWKSIHMINVLYIFLNISNVYDNHIVSYKLYEHYYNFIYNTYLMINTIQIIFLYMFEYVYIFTHTIYMLVYVCYGFWYEI